MVDLLNAGAGYDEKPYYCLFVRRPALTSLPYKVKAGARDLFTAKRGIYSVSPLNSQNHPNCGRASRGQMYLLFFASLIASSRECTLSLA